MERTFRRAKVEDVAVLTEHVDLLNTGDGLDVELLERALQLFVVLRGRRLRLPHDLAAHGPLTACTEIAYARVSARVLQRPLLPPLLLAHSSLRPAHNIRRSPSLSTAREGKRGRQRAGEKRTDPVGRGLGLQLGQFCGVHGDDCRGSGVVVELVRRV